MSDQEKSPKHFAYIIDGEVAHIQSLHPTIHPLYEELCAVFSSNPQIVEIDSSVSKGYKYNSVTKQFTA